VPTPDNRKNVSVKKLLNYLTVISHEATILKAAAWCLLIPPDHKFLYNSYWKKILEAEEKLFSRF